MSIMIMRFMRCGDPSGGDVGNFPVWITEFFVMLGLGMANHINECCVIQPERGLSRVVEVLEVYEGIWTSAL